MSETVLATGGLRVLVEAAPDHLAWLEEFLGPAFERAAGAAPDWRVTLREDAAGYRRALDRGPADGARAAFAFDAKVMSLTCLRREAADEGGPLRRGPPAASSR